MSILDNIKGGRGGDEGDPNGKFNPFRLLEIGEIMVRYTDGIRIKDFVFLAVLTSERLILLDSARQGTGQITKEIPFSVIKQADLERDERDRPTLAISMEVSGQSRVMRLVFTGLISEPETECREWFTAINGYPPERVEQPEIRLDEPADAPYVEPAPIPVRQPEPTPVPVPIPVQAPPVIPVPPAQPVIPTPQVQPQPEIPAPAVAPVVVPAPIVTPTPAPEPVPVPQQIPVVPVQQAQPAYVSPAAPTIPSVQSGAKRPIPTSPPSEGTIRILVEKPDISPVMIHPETIQKKRPSSSKSMKHCINCGVRIPLQSRFCQTCGSQQT